MKYMGSKGRIAKEILPIMESVREEGQAWIEPFVGGANLIDKVDKSKGQIRGSDSNIYLIELLKSLSIGGIPTYITKDEYNKIKECKDSFPKYLVGYAGICCSYSGKWFGGYAGKVHTKGGLRDYQQEAIDNITKQSENLEGIEFLHSSFDELEIPQNSLVYCDPPYEGTTKYHDRFNHRSFWRWCRRQIKNGHIVFVSEYNAPDDFICIWQKGLKSSLSANGKSGGNKESVERLFIHESQTHLIK